MLSAYNFHSPAHGRPLAHADPGYDFRLILLPDHYAGRRQKEGKVFPSRHERSWLIIMVIWISHVKIKVKTAKGLVGTSVDG